jgi:hypothetical protein
MRMRARTWLLLRLALFAVALASAAVYLLRWPSAWDAVELGMARSRVLELVGAPTTDAGPVGGQFWVEQRHFARYELWLTFDRSGRVAAFTIDRRLGTAERFHQQRLRGDLSERIAR